MRRYAAVAAGQRNNCSGCRNKMRLRFQFNANRIYIYISQQNHNKLCTVALAHHKRAPRVTSRVCTAARKLAVQGNRRM